MKTVLKLTVGALAIIGAVVVIKKIKGDKSSTDILCGKCACEDICGCKTKNTTNTCDTENACGTVEVCEEPNVDECVACNCNCANCAAFNHFDTAEEVAEFSEEDIAMKQEAEGNALEPSTDE